MKTFTEQIREAILNSGVTPYILANDAGISESVLSRFLNGSSGLTLKTLDALASVLGWKITQTVQRISRPRSRGRKAKGSGMIAFKKPKTKQAWQEFAKACALDAHKNHFPSRRGIWQFEDLDVLCIYNNNPYVKFPERRDQETNQFRKWLKQHGIKELAYATYSGDPTLPDYTYAMIVDAGPELETVIVGEWQRILAESMPTM